MRKLFDVQTEKFEINGVSISYRVVGKGNNVVLLHGYPQNSLIWHKIVPYLEDNFRLLMPDLRGYGESSKPDASNEDHSIYCKRTSASDIVELAKAIGMDFFHIVGHDRGARVAHRLILDNPGLVKSFVSLDVMPSQEAFDKMDSSLAFAWFHWNLMRQPYPLPETMIGNSAEKYFDFLMEKWCATENAIDEEVYKKYKTDFCNPQTVHSTCAEYRSIALDLEHDEVDRGKKIDCPMLALWGSNTAKRPGWQTGKGLNMIDAWKNRCKDVSGQPLDCGHFIPEEKPQELINLLLPFFSRIDKERTAL
ncbi:MAG: alpha/beta hydrolase [Pseudomonadota bacterium]|nr:alpha/beta hydrolase [Pseudomonadota bacterium]